MIAATKLAEAPGPQLGLQRKNDIGMPAVAEQMIVGGRKTITLQTQLQKAQRAYLPAAMAKLQTLVEKY
ncbi:hypothetical protein HF329_05510 [Chitinophaga oryzae]|uniref:Uncharacterized protein n=1 Tax=Chitinophaga oryzae TaxID=2725414 RepID=A0AAE6ZD53_9BACT|nr:hypothetical protein [Chitinophaga oryzae]QJB30783.1 hypothetical protein HF329_05510 [Chitinophaga oryzae]